MANTRTPVSSPPSLTAVAARVDARIDALFETELARWREVDAELVEPLTSLRRLVDAGGKRLRPAFCYWGFVGAGGEGQHHLLDIGRSLRSARGR